MSPYSVPGLKRREEILKSPSTINKLVTKCCQFLEVEETTLKKKCRKRELVQSRMMIMYVLYQKGFTLKTIGDAFSKDHTTVIHAKQTIQNMMAVYPDIKLTVDNLRKFIIEIY